MATPAASFALFYDEWESALDDVLRQNAREAGKRIADLPHTIPSAQAAMARRVAQNAVSATYSDIYRMLQTGRIDAAALGAQLTDDEWAAFRAAGLDDEAIDVLANAARYEAAAGAEAAARRVSGQTKVPLSQQVYRTTQLSKGAVDKAINAALAQGMSASQLAKMVRDMIRPDVPGGVSYAAKRLGRTELNNAFHESAKARMASTPWTEAVRWHLSGSHSTPDICNEYANNDNEGLGEGLWPPGKVPAKPHPQCLCYVTAELPSDAKFVQNMRNGDYDPYLDDIMRQAGYDEAFIAQSRFANFNKAADAAAKRTAAYVKAPAGRAATATNYKSGQQAWDSLNSPVLKREAKDALDHYQGTGYMSVNEELRFAEGALDDVSDDVVSFIKGMDQAMADNTLSADVRVYRGLDEVDWLDDLKPGAEISDHAYTSTSIDREIAEDFASYGEDNGVVLEILVPKGTHGIKMTGYEETSDELEVILDRGVRIVVDSVKRNARTTEGERVTWVVGRVVQ